MFLCQFLRVLKAKIMNSPIFFRVRAQGALQAKDATSNNDSPMSSAVCDLSERGG